ncbi:signal peptidase II [Candidatus Woesearchaeota archaeon]|nr:signal peptidase II [Candidatus Woesearchaeota archaeon]MCF7901213.1 signal peptidase II [Candidatus Woesearchaeota archaeon]MCF8013692.1 signal peptidase II [Candidatus Woesearchaeota archaeon]
MVKKIKSKNKIKSKTIFFGIIIFLLAIDQITKHILKNVSEDFGFLAITFVKNTGVSFGMLQGSNTIIILISIIFLGLLYYYRKEFEKNEIFAILIITGILGNLIDRIFIGYVIDFINLKWWPVFNFADAFIFIGVFGFVIRKFFEKTPKK